MTAAGGERPVATAAGAFDLPDVLEFMQLLWSLVHALDRRSKDMHRRLGVTGPQRLGLRIIGLFPGISASDLAGVLRVHPSTITGVLHRLVSARLVARVADPLDRRRAVLRLTPLGRRLNGMKTGTVEASVRRGLARVKRADRDVARRILRTLVQEVLGHASAPDRQHGRPRS